MVALADARDVMTAERSSSAALTAVQALEGCRRPPGRRFAAGLVAALVAALERLVRAEGQTGAARIRLLAYDGGSTD